jgi:hypothetical protein
LNWPSFFVGFVTFGVMSFVTIAVYVRVYGPFLVGPPEPPNKEKEKK